MQGSRPTHRKRAAPSVRSSRCCASAWSRKDKSWWPNIPMTASPARAWTAPVLDALRDAAEAGHIESMWCLSADRLARMYAYQVIVLDELARHGVSVSFLDTPKIEDDPQARLLTQVQGVIAEYERAKIAERYRRGKLWRSRAGEVIAWKPSYGYRRIPRVGERPAHLEVFEHEAAGRAAHLRRLCPQGPLDAPDRQGAELRRYQLPKWTGGVGRIDHRAHLAQRSLHRPRLCESNRGGAGPTLGGENSSSAAPEGSMDRHRGSGRPRRRAVRSGRSVSVVTTRSGARGAPNLDTGCYAGWSSVDTAP